MKPIVPHPASQRWIARAFRVLLSLAAVLAAWTLLNRVVWPLPYDRLHRPASIFVFARDGQLLSRFTAPDDYWRKPVTLHDVSPLMVKSVLAIEDKWFYWHPGVNPVSLVMAAMDNLRARRIVRGGSTITMQIARMMEPKERTIPNKIIEVFRAIQLELNFSKEELLELYFNMAPYGGNIEGIAAASYLYFDKPPNHLSLSEIATLAALPNSPTELRPDRNLARCTAARNRIVARLCAKGIVTTADGEQAREEKIPTARGPAPAVAPHFCQMLRATQKGAAEIRSTVDYRLQIACERLARNYQSGLALKGIYSTSVVVLDNSTGNVLAMVGSTDFGDVAHQGQVNGALAPRSPGSALKPFAYVLAFDNGIATPGFKLEDIPVNYAGYVPVNFDEQFHGMVSVSEALIQSLNVPAVNLTAKVGLKRVYRALQAGGVTTLTRKHFDYGLPLILGSCEVNLLELSNLYATLARGGRTIPVQVTQGDVPPSGETLFSPEASYLMTEILAELKRPELPSSWEFTADLPRVAWKTGTSYGRRDAWAIGYDRDFTVGVWAGNFTAEGSIALVGAEVAAPLMFKVFGQLYPHGQTGWFRAPSGIGERMICTSSGQVAGDLCPDRIAERYIIGVSPITKCGVHRALLVDQKTGYSLCTYCAAGKEVRQATVEDWPPCVAAWLTARGMIGLVPAHNPECRGMFAGLAPEITSPEQEAVYLIRPSAPLEYQQILFSASPAADCRQLLWFLDGELFSKVVPGSAVFYSPERGTHQLVCVDSYGRSSSVRFRVQ